jgi:excinuclease ABC subunit C
VAEPTEPGSAVDRSPDVVAEDAVELEQAPVGAATALPVHGAAAGDSAEIGRVQPVAGSGT